jgi:hypothetical protein
MGNQWMVTYPYALPNLISAFFLGASAFSLFLFLKEVGTHSMQVQADNHRHTSA